MQELNLTKQNIIEDIIQEVLFSGWTNKTIDLCFTKNSINPKLNHLYLPNGFDDVFNYVINKIDSELEFWAKNELTNIKSLTKKITIVIKKRIEYGAQYKPFLRSAVSYYVSRFGFIYLTKNLFSTCNKIWKLSGDNSTDISYYTKRLILSKIYLKSLMFWFSDNSDDNIETYNFIDREISNISSISNIKKRIKDLFN